MIFLTIITIILIIFAFIAFIYGVTIYDRLKRLSRLVDSIEDRLIEQAKLNYRKFDDVMYEIEILKRNPEKKDAKIPELEKNYIFNTGSVGKCIELSYITSIDLDDIELVSEDMIKNSLFNQMKNDILKYASYEVSDDPMNMLRHYKATIRIINDNNDSDVFSDLRKCKED